jgi:WD40 repeat protein
MHAVAWSPDSKHLASGGFDESVQVWDATTGNMLLSYHGHSDVVVALSWTSHGDRIASTGFDKTVQVWQAE